MRDEVAATDAPGPRRGLDQPIGPGIDPAASVEADRELDAHESGGWVDDAFIGVELFEQTLYVPQRKDMAHYAVFALRLKKSARVSPEIIEDSGRGGSAQELGSCV